MPIDRATLIDLYQGRRLSMPEVASRLSCSVNTVVYWMTKHGIPRRDYSEATLVCRNPVPPFELKASLTHEDELLKATALGIYLGEGNKRSDKEVRVGNSDPLILRIFVRFLIEVCGVRPEKIRVNIVKHPDVPTFETEKFWSGQLNIPLSQFQKTTTIVPRGNGTYRHRCEHGVATVSVCSIELRRLIQRWLQDLIVPR